MLEFSSTVLPAPSPYQSNYMALEQCSFIIVTGCAVVLAFFNGDWA